MLDFDTFWAEAGCLPGLSREQTEDQLRQMAAYFGQFVSGTPDLSDSPGLNPGPGLTAEQLDAWEQENGVRLPDALRHALQRQDGGYLRDNRFRIYSLAEFRRPDEEFWEWAGYKEEEIPERQLVFGFAENDEFGGRYFLNFNAEGPQAEPSVFVHHHDPGDLDRCAKSLTKFLARMLESSETPLAAVPGTGSQETITQETIDRAALFGKSAALEQTLARPGGALVLLTHEMTPAGERYTRTTLPEPFDEGAFNAGAIVSHRPAPTATFALHLQPRNTEGIVQVESQQVSNGRWKNTTQKGVPIYVHFESADRVRLETLRRLLFGKEGAARAQTRQDKQDQLQEKLASLTPEENYAAAMQMFSQTQELFLKMQEQLGGLPPAESPNPQDKPPTVETLAALVDEKLREAMRPDMPAEVAALAKLVNEKFRETMRRSREIMAQHPVDPEVLRLLKENMPQPPEAEEKE
jgi:hypothetical protein